MAATRISRQARQRLFRRMKRQRDMYVTRLQAAYRGWRDRRYAKQQQLQSQQHPQQLVEQHLLKKKANLLLCYPRLEIKKLM